MLTKTDQEIKKSNFYLLRLPKFTNILIHKYFNLNHFYFLYMIDTL